MSLLDTYIVYKFLRLLTTPWDEMPAFQLGIIDSRGHVLKSSKELKTKEERSAFTLFHRLVFNIKRLIERIPGGKTKLGTYAAALFLLREKLNDQDSILILERSFMGYLNEHNAVRPQYLDEQYLPEELLPQGAYTCLNTILDCNGDLVSEGTTLIATENLRPTARVLGIDVYQLRTADTGKAVVVSFEDVEEM